MTQQMPELKACPFCGSRDIDPDGVYHDNGSYPACNNCSASCENWNNRADIAEPVDTLLAEAIGVYQQCDFVTVGEPDYCPPLEFIKRYVPELITHAIKTQAELTNEHRIKVLREMGFGHEMINEAHIVTYDGYKGFFINHTNLMCAMQRIPRAFTVLIHAALKSPNNRDEEKS